MQLEIRGARLSYPKLFTPEVGPNGGAPQYSACFVVPPEATARIKGEDEFRPAQRVLKEAVAQAVKAEWGEKAKAKFAKVKHAPIRDDIEGTNYPEGSVYINAKTFGKTTAIRPGIVESYAGDDGKPKTVADEDSDRAYPGRFVNGLVDVFAGEHSSGGPYVTWALRGTQLGPDADRFDNYVDAAEEFEADESLVADLSDIVEETVPAGEEDDLSDLLG